MGKKHHTRVVINGSPVYNLGGATCKQLKSQADDKNWHPFIAGAYPLTLGTGSFELADIRTVTLIFITRTPGRNRRVDEVYQYTYGLDGIIDRHHGTLHMYVNKKAKPVYFAPNDFTYRLAINYIDMCVKPGDDLLWKVRAVAPMVKPPKLETKPTGILERFKSWFRRHFIDQ